MQLYTRATSSCSFRVRIALNLKGLSCDFVPVVSRDQLTGEFGAVNPQRLIPFLINGPDKIGQSISIMEYLDEKFGPPSLLPSDPAGRARVRAISQYIVSDIQPLQNTRIDPQLQRWVSNSCSCSSEFAQLCRKCCLCRQQGQCAQYQVQSVCLHRTCHNNGPHAPPSSSTVSRALTRRSGSIIGLLMDSQLSKIC